MPDRFDHLFIAPSDFDASLKFYRDTLGWQVTKEWTDEHGKRVAEFSSGGVRLVIAEPHAPHEMRDIVAKAHPNSATVHLDIHDADERFSKVAPGDHVVIPPENNERGTRWFVLRDPDGNVIAFNEMRQKH